MDFAKGYVLAEEMDRLHQSGATLDDILALLRGRGLSKLESVSIVMGLREFGTSRLSEAKAAVHNSAVWADAKDRDENIL
jgi:hypothetical protein